MTDAAYGSLLAALYDDRESVTEREADVAFYRDRARDADGPVLELACGTGRIYLDVLADGVDADGIDASAPTLEVLRSRAAERGLDPTVWQADLTDFDVEREYALVYCPFNALQHVHAVADQLAALRSVYDALAPGGALLFDVFVPSFELICDQYGEWTAERVPYEGAEHEVRQRSRIVDEVEQRVRVQTELYRTDGELVDEETFEITMLPAQHVELLARQSPFERWSVAGGFEGQAFEDGATTQVWTLEKGDC